MLLGRKSPFDFTVVAISDNSFIFFPPFIFGSHEIILYSVQNAYGKELNARGLSHVVSEKEHSSAGDKTETGGKYQSKIRILI